MSWSFGVTDVAPRELEAKLLEEATKNLVNFDAEPDVRAAVREQHGAAISTALELLHSRAILPEGAVSEHNVNCYLSGHANPDHQPRSGWATDTITVSMSQAPVLVPA